MVGKRILGVLLVVGAAVTGFYWWSFFAGGDVMSAHERWYMAFEASFPVADGWMALCMAAAGFGLIGDRAWALPVGLMAGSALIYLSAMDITFNVENHMYALAPANDAMKFEIFINVSSAMLGVWTLIASWPKSR
jgi:hypothetical protein